MKILKLKNFIISSLLFLLTGCYSGHLMLIPNYSPGVYTNQRTIIFYYSLQASHPPKGISRFPDGGRHKKIYKNFSLYEFDTINKKIHQIHDFGKMTSSSWHSHLSLENNKLLFSIIPVMGRQWLTEPDTESEKFNNPRVGFYLYDLKTKEIKQLPYDGYDPILSPDLQQVIYKQRTGDTVSIWHLQLETRENKQIVLVDSIFVFSPLFWTNNNQPGIYIKNKPYSINLETGKISALRKEINYRRDKATITEIKRLTHELSFKEWGFELSEYYAKNKHHYISDIIHLHGNFNFRKAIIEELKEDLTKNEIVKILEKMNKYALSLPEFEKRKYTFYSKETRDLLIQVLKEKNN
ncbi:MAG TPA: hypothetical protein VK982_12995 [Bacteroidales bacterium]|nr:hypothetical protein [Bacteroidales bacterium]